MLILGWMSVVSIVAALVLGFVQAPGSWLLALAVVQFFPMAATSSDYIQRFLIEDKLGWATAMYVGAYVLSVVMMGLFYGAGWLAAAAVSFVVG